MAVMMGSRLSQDELMGMLVGAFAVDVVLVIIMICFHTLLMFSFPLIIDQNLGAVQAMTTSARAVLKNLKGVTGLILVNFGIVIAGYAALCFGIYFAIPIMIATHVVAYRKVFPNRDDLRFDPPSPNMYAGRIA